MQNNVKQRMNVEACCVMLNF